MVLNSIAPAIRTDSRPVYRRKTSSDYQRPATPAEMHKSAAVIGCTEPDAGRKTYFTGQFPPSRHFGEATVGK
jgi:hypothetical protein